MDRGRATEALGAQHAVLDSIATTLADDDLLRPTGCVGWTVSDLLLHMLLDAQRAPG